MKVLSDTSNGDIGWKKYVCAGWAFMECLFFGGLLYGWSSVVFVLKTEKIYADLCPRSNLTEHRNHTDEIPIENVTYVPVLVNNASITSGPGLNDYTFVVGNDSSTRLPVPGDYQGPCKPQDGNMALCFSIASALFCIGCAVMGHIQYKCGTRVTRLVAFVMFVAGSLMMAFISIDKPWLMFPGLSLLGLGGLPLLVTNAQVSLLFTVGSSSVMGLLCGGYDMSSAGLLLVKVSNLFLVGSSSIVGLLCGGFDVSSSVMLLVKIAHENGFARRNMFLVITSLYVLTLVNTFLLLPRWFISKPSGKGSQDTGVARDQDAAVELLPGTENPNSAMVESKSSVPTLKSCLLRPIYILHVVWLCLLQVRFYFFLGTLNTYLNSLLEEDNERVSYFTNVCFYTMMGGLVSSFFSGIVYDAVKRWCKDGKSQQYREVLPAALPLAIASLLSVLLSVLVLIPDTKLLYVIFIVMTLKRSFLYSMAAAFLSAIFPSEYFGLLYGVMIMAGGIVGLLQYALFLWTEAYHLGAFHANVFQLVLVSLSFVHPLYLWITCWKQERQYKLN